MTAAGWAKSTVETYITKQWRDLVERLPDGKILVKPDFQRFSEEQFLDLATQNRKVFSKYRRVKYDDIVTYEFLLPLTREDQLRKALDELFYKDTVRHRLLEIGLTKAASFLPRGEEESDDEYIEKICGAVSRHFGGYSISHVSGRYRAANLTTRENAASMLIHDERYIIDETTASVRFIIPLEATMTAEPDSTSEGSLFEPAQTSDIGKDVNKEISLVRFLFFDLFVEAIVRMVKEEDEIWLVEEAAGSRILYAWRRA
ncbi:MAG: hypothetical protein QOJ70_3628 [Acidobacteriota bacterium]|nr:hypothetical protein [Acidobacteriota bacterium]